MGELRSHSPVLLFVAAFAAERDHLAWGREQLTAKYGNIVLSGKQFCVDDYTNYYAKTMGTQLIKEFWAFEKRISPETLPDIKCWTNNLETALALDSRLRGNDGGGINCARPINLDPGYVTPAKLILASTKDHAHRIFLRDGIFAETTLIFARGVWTPLPWTYPDYQTSLCHEFLNRCRALLNNTTQ